MSFTQQIEAIETSDQKLKAERGHLEGIAQTLDTTKGVSFVQISQCEVEAARERGMQLRKDMVNIVGGAIHPTEAMLALTINNKTRSRIVMDLSDSVLIETILMADHSGIASEEGTLHIHDTCAGIGQASMLISLLLEGKINTAVTCWDIDTSRRLKRRSTLIRNALRRSLGSYTYRHTPMYKADLSAEPGVPSYVFGKKSCRSATSQTLEVLAKAAHLPAATVLTPCCYAESEPIPPLFNQLEGFPIIQSDWQKLKRRAEEGSFEAGVGRRLGVIAERMMDFTRACAASMAIKHTSVQVLEAEISPLVNPRRLIVIKRNINKEN